MKETVKVFVYGTLKEGCRLSHATEHLRISVKKSTTSGFLWDTGWGFPALEIPAGNQSCAYECHGEIHEFKFEALTELDRIEGYPRLYNRCKTNFKTEDGEIVSAWVYEMNDIPSGAKLIKNGVWED